MKNRLQFNRIPTIFSGETVVQGGEEVWVSGREQAAEALDRYIKRGSFIPLIGEPIVLRYTDDKGDRQVMLAIGKSTGATIDMVGDREYHIIDSAYLQEGVDQANENASEALELASAATKDTADYLTILKNMILSGIGLTDGTYFDNNGRWDRDPSQVGLYDPDKVDGTFYLKEATSFLDADKKLDAAIVATNGWLNGRCDGLQLEINNLNGEIDKEHGYRKAIAIKEIDQQYYERLGLGNDIKAAYFLTTHKPGDGNFEQYEYPQNGEVIIKVYKDEVSREEFENVLAAEGLNPDGTYDHERAHDSINFKDAFDAFTADELLDKAISDLSASTMASNTELNEKIEETNNSLSELSAGTVSGLEHLSGITDNIIEAAGLNPDGTFNHNHESNYMGEAYSLVENDLALDAAIADLSANTMAADAGLGQAIAGTNAMLNGRCDMLQTQIDEEKTYRKSIKLRKLTPSQIQELELGNNVLAAYDLVDHHNYPPTTAETIVKVYKDNINSLDLDYVPDENKIVLSWNDGLEDRSTFIDVSDFVKDSFLTGVEVVVSGGNKYMKFNFKTYDDKPLPIYVPIEDFAVLYDVLPESYNYLTIDNEVYKIGAKVDVEHGLAGYDTMKFISGLTENIISGAGLNLLNPGAYPGHDETHYIKNAGSLDQADVLLDEAIWHVSGSNLELSASVVNNENVINNILRGTGLNTGEPGSYPGHDETHYIKDATSLDNADVLLDAAIWETSGLVADISNRVDELSAVTESFSAHTVEALSALSISVDERIESGLTFISGVVENYVEERLSGLNFDEIYEYIDSGDTALYEYIDSLSGSILEYVIDNELVTAAALNDLNDRIRDLSGNTIGNIEELSASVVNNRTDIDTLSATMVDNELVTAAALNDLNRRIIDNDEDIADILIELENVSAKTSGVLTLSLNGVEQGQYCPSANTSINLEAIQEVTGEDVLLTNYEISTATSQEDLVILPTDNVNQAFGKLEKKVNDSVECNQSAITVLSALIEDNELVTAAALNDLNDRIIELSGETEDMYIDLLNKINNLSLSGASELDLIALSASVITLSSVTVQIENEVGDCFDDVAYDSTTKRINFKHGNDVKKYIDATDFIKDGMVDNVTTGTPSSGPHAGVECLIITFNADAGKETIEIPLSDIFDTSLLDDLSGSVVNNFNLINALSADMIDNELVIAAAFNDLNARIIDLSGDTPDMSNYYTKSEAYNQTEVNNLISGATLRKYQTASTLTNLAFNEFLTIVKINGSTTLSIASTGLPVLPANGVAERHLIIENTGSTDAVVTITADSRIKLTMNNLIAIDRQTGDRPGIGELNALITYDGSAYTIYVITT